MQRSLVYRLAGIAFALAIFVLAASPAFADDFGKRFTVDVGAVWNISTTGDAMAPPPPGGVGLGYGAPIPQPSSLQWEYGAVFRIDPRTNLYYAHSILDFAIGRVLTLGPGLALVSGGIYDRTDTMGISRYFFKNFVGHLFYYNHARMDVSGLCLNQIQCATGPGGSNVPNPASIDEHGYGVGFTYGFGPLTPIGPLFTAGFDAKYVPRSSTPPTDAPNLGGLGSYVGSQWLLPYSITAKLPISNSHSFIPFIGYERAAVLFRNEATPEMYNVVDFGIVKVFNKNLSLSFTNLNFSGCRCSDTVPPPDNIRFAEALLKLDYKTNL